MVLVSVVTGDPVRRRDDVDACLKDFHVEVLVGEYAVEGQYVWLGGDDLVDRPGGDDAVTCQTGDLAGIEADLFRCVTMQSDELEIRPAGDPFDHLGPDVAGRDLEHPDRCADAHRIQ